MSVASRGFAALTVAAALLIGMPAARAGEVLIAVAANFTAATKQITPLFEAATGHRVRTSFGSTGKLYAQIKNGAPFDVFLAADQRRPGRLEDEGVAVPGSRFTYATGRLVLWSADAGRVDPEGAVLSAERIERLAIANPKTAPYGAATLEVLQRLGIEARLRPRLVQGESISQTFQFVSTRNATLGFIALSQLRSLPEARGSAWIVPQDLYTPIRQDAVLLRRAAENTAARDWLKFLRGPRARRVIQQLGYGTE